MHVDTEDIFMAFVLLFFLFVYICIGAFFAWTIGMDEVSLAYVGVLFFWPIIGVAAYVAMILAWGLVVIVIGGVVGIFKENGNG